MQDIKQAVYKDKQAICKNKQAIYKTRFNKYDLLKSKHDTLQGNTRHAQANTHDTLKLTHDTNTGWWHEGTLYRAAPCLNRTGNEAGQFAKFLRSSSSNIHAPFLLISSDHSYKTDIPLQIRAICLLLRKSGIFSKQPFLAQKAEKWMQDDRFLSFSEP